MELKCVFLPCMFYVDILCISEVMRAQKEWKEPAVHTQGPWDRFPLTTSKKWMKLNGTFQRARLHCGNIYAKVVTQNN